MRRGLDELWGNPSSVHRFGQEARHGVELARRSLAELIGADPKQIVLTGSGTESIDLAVRGVLGAGRRLEAPPVLVSTRVEHAAVRDLLSDLERVGAATVHWATVDRAGIVDVRALEGLLEGPIALVSVQWANNETGVVQPVAAIGEICRSRRIPFHCDATQWVGKMPADVNTLPVDLLTFSPHKFHGPKGVGVLWTRRGLRLRPVIHGAQELGRRGGTENVPGILGAGVASAEAAAWLGDGAERARLAAMRDRFERAVLAGVSDARVNGARAGEGGTGGQGAGVERIWNTTNIAFPRLEAEALLMLLSERGLCASAGAACSSGSLDPSPVLLAMGVEHESAHGSLRFSLSRFTTEAEIDEGVRIVVESVRRLRESLPVTE